MKVALLISGYLRTFKENVSNIEKNIINKFDNIDVYIHITKHENEEDKYLNPSDIYEDIKFVNERLNPISLLVEDNLDIISLKNTWIKFNKLNFLKSLNEEQFGKYDLVIKCRPDFNLISTDVFDRKIQTGVVYIPKDSKINKSILKNDSDGYICDIFAFGTSRTMDRYFNIYGELNNLIETYGTIPETVLFNYLKDWRIQYILLDIEYEVILSKCNVFAICGDSGSGKSTLSKLLKDTLSNSFTLECDRYHKWERTSEKWSEYTHLNPNANYISKMNEDIFNLKIGKDIFQVDYDHHSGKFTEKQMINPADNLIVCGLHSLYNNDSVYDLKIYMDTDDDLKKKWKINRDVKERGYSIEKVLTSIKKREHDFNEYITPQKENADIIVRFFTLENIDFDNLEETNVVSLEIGLGNHLNITPLLQSLKNSNIDFTKEINDKFTNIKFLKYTDSIIFNQIIPQKTYTFYDYVLYFILNLGLTN